MSAHTDLTKALIRADLWRLLALGFHCPDGDNREKTLAVGGDLVESLEALHHPLAKPVADFVDAYATWDATALEHEYHALFSTDVLVNPYEGGYHRQERGSVMGDVSAFYEAFGLVPEQHTGPPDSLWNELAFLSWMALKEAYALDQDLAEAYLLANEGSASFLRDHLARWTAAYCQQLSLTTGNAVYVTGAELLVRTVSHCLDELGVEEVHALAPLVQAPEEQGEVVCPAAGAPTPDTL